MNYLYSEYSQQVNEQAIEKAAPKISLFYYYEIKIYSTGAPLKIASVDLIIAVSSARMDSTFPK